MTDEQARLRFNVTDSGGDGPTMVFAHGFGCDQRMWRFVAPAFEATHRVILFDHIGSGRSDARAFDPARHGSLDGYADDVAALLDALDLRDVIFVGHSISASIGALATLRGPRRMARLVMLGPSPRFLDDPPDYLGGFERDDIEGLLEMIERNLVGWADYLAHAVAGGGETAAAEELKTSFCSADPAILRCFARTTFLSDCRAALPRVPVPALVVQMEDDAIVPVEVGDYCHRQLRGSTLKRLPISGHAPHLTHPALTIALIRDYLAHPVEALAA